MADDRGETLQSEGGVQDGESVLSSPPAGDARGPDPLTERPMESNTTDAKGSTCFDHLKENRCMVPHVLEEDQIHLFHTCQET